MRLHQFQEFLAEQRIDLAFFVHPDISITYFTQREFSDAFLIISPSSVELHVTSLDHRPEIRGIEVKKMTKDWEKILPTKARKIAINKRSITVSCREKLETIFPQAEFIDVSVKLHELRQQKTSSELEKIEKACAITVAAYHSLLKALAEKKFLRTEQDVALFLEKNIRQQGAELAFPTIVAMGKNTLVPHHKTSLQTLKQGPLLVDFGARYKLYCADMTRVIFLGTAGKDERKYYNLLLQVQEKAIKAAQIGKSFAELTDTVKKCLGKYSCYFTHSLGHGIGLEVHESPVFSEAGVVQENVPFTVEPGIYLPGKYGFRIEDTIVWNSKRLKVMTKCPKEITVV